jgi:ribosomal-protein-alanine N-acetyltransferase
LLAGYHCLVLEIGGSVTGYGIMSIAAGEAHLLNLCVHPNAHHLGYGRRLLAAMLTKAEDAGAERVFLEVRPSNAVALQLYRSVGFEQIGMRPAYYQATGGREDAIVLATALTPQR